MTVEFKFESGQKVKSIIGDIGIITTASTDKNKRIFYHVLMNGGSGAWFDEDQIEAFE